MKEILDIIMPILIIVITFIFFSMGSTGIIFKGLLDKSDDELKWWYFLVSPLVILLLPLLSILIGLFITLDWSNK